MKSTDFKRFGKHFGVMMMLAIIICIALVCSSMSASAMSLIDDADKMGHGNDGHGRYYSSFESNEELKAVTKATNIEIASEGTILLKNGGGADGSQDKLPYKDMRNISLFGINSDAFGYGGTGSGSGQLEEGADIYTSFASAGLTVNPKLKELYQKYSGGSLSDTSAWSVPTYEDKELPMDYYTESITNTYNKYGDAAFIVIGRLGGEGADLAVKDVANHVRPNPVTGELEPFGDEHYLELTYREEQLIKHVEENFEKVVVLFNSGNIIEFGELADDPQIDAIVHIGQTGDYGMQGVLKVLKGEVSPSGRTVDIYTRDFTVDPVFKNFGNGSQTVEEGTNYSYTYTDPANNLDKARTGNMIEYEEGIYLGYKYYETMYSEIKAGNVDVDSAAGKAALYSDDLDAYLEANSGVEYTSADGWYDTNVVYPFGYGLSYTTFEWSGFEVKMDTDTLTTETRFTATVTVKNTGDVAGKDVVELYMSAPYDKTTAPIEKAAVSLVGFAKTKTLAPNETQQLKITFDAYDIAAYDYNDANDSGHTGYEIEAGDYTFLAQKNSHVAAAGCSKTLTFPAVEFTNSQTTGAVVDNVFVDSPDEKAIYNYSSISPTMTIMSRGDMLGTYPKAPTADDLALKPGDDKFNPLAANKKYKITEEEIYKKSQFGFILGRDDDSHEIWNLKKDGKEIKLVPDDWTQAADEKGTVTIRLADLMGLSPWDDTTKVDAKYNANAALAGLTAAQAWVKFMNQLTYEEMKMLNSIGFFKTAGIDRIGKEEAVDADGPCTIGGQTKDGYISARGSSGTRYWCSAQMVAATWNVELANRQGVLIGEEGMWNGYNGWYAPSMNTHRSPFSGRNFEYYSQDGVHAGLITGAVISGVSSRGVYPYIKHFALNDQETSRGGLYTWADEQTIREIYLRPYQYAVQQGGASGVMTGFNRIGTVACSENYPLLTQILREEWGFEGSVVTDYQVGTVGDKTNNLEIMTRSGNNIPLGDRAANARGGGQWDPKLRDNKGGVKVGVVTMKDNQPIYSTEEFVENNRQTEMQYYYTRIRAMELLYTHMRSNAIDNGADFQKNFASQTIELPAGLSNMSVKIPTGFDQYADVKYELVESKLPAGVKLDIGKLTLTANNAKLSTGSVSIKVSYDGWANKTVEFKVAVVEPIKFDGKTAVALNAPYEATVSQDVWKANPDLGAQESGIKSVKASVEGLPSGLAFDAATGKITGTPTAGGAYKTTLKYAVENQSYNWWNGQVTTRTTNYTRTVELEVGDLVTVTVDGVAQKVVKGATIAAPETPEAPDGQQFVGWYVGDSDTAFDFSAPVNENVTVTARFAAIPDSIEFRVENGKVQASINGGEWYDVIALDDITGPAGPKGETGPQGPEGKAAEGGCGSLAGSSVAIIVLSAFALAFVGFKITKAVKERKEK